MRGAGALLVVACLLIVLGAPAPWVTCSQEPCPLREGEGGLGLMVIFERSGLAVGWGIATVVLGLVILAIAVTGSRQPSLVPLARLAGVATLVVAVGFALRVWVVPEYESYGPRIGFLATSLGGLIAAVGDPVLRRRSPRR